MALTPDILAALVRSLGLPEDPPLGPPTLALTPQDPRLKPSTQALLKDPLLRALSDLDRVLAGPRASTMGAATFDIECPWSHEHTDRATSGTVYVPLRTKFRCHHGHCAERTHEHLRLKVDEMLRADSGGLVGLVHYEFDALDPGTLPDPPAHTAPMELFFQDTIFVACETRQRFWSISERIKMDDTALNEKWRVALSDVLPIDARSPKSKPHKMSPSQWYLVHDRRRRATGWISWPGAGVIHVHNKRPLVNTWRPHLVGRVDHTVTDAEVTPWLALMRFVFGTDTLEEAENLEIILDWLAMVMGSWVKPGWHPVITGLEGLGKDVVVAWATRALGEMYADLPSHRLTETYNPWGKVRFLHLSEAKQTTRGTATPHDQMNVLKLWDNTRDIVQVREMYTKPYEARNVMAIWITSNEEVPLKLSPTDRRFMVFDRRHIQPQPAKGEALVKWLDAEGMEGFKGWELVQQWLVQRWASMPDYRKDVLTRPAPMTQAKADMIEADKDDVEIWAVQGMSALSPAPEAWPDIVSRQYVHERMCRAITNGTEGLHRRVVPLNIHKVGQLLAKLGAVRLNKGVQVRVNGVRHRLWAVRETASYEGLDPNVLARVAEKGWISSNTTDFDA